MKIRFILVMAGLCLFFSTPALACEDTAARLNPQDRPAFELGKLAGKVGLANLGIKNIEPGNLLVITNAGYGRFNDLTSIAALEGIGWATDTSLGQRNLLRIQTPRLSPVWFFLFHRPTGDGVYLEAPRLLKGEPAARIFRIQKENIAAARLLDDVTYWEGRIKDRAFGGREFSLVTMANQWAAGAPYELLQAGTFHDHVCPGVTMGFLIAEYLERNYPLASGERYHILNPAPNCHDDALQVLFNATAGKGFFTLVHLTDQQRGQLSPKVRNITGVYVIWNPRTESGRAVGLVFDWDLLKTKREGIGWVWRLRMNQELLGYLDRPEGLLKKAFEKDLPPGTKPATLIQADQKSLGDAGLIDQVVR